MSVVAPTFYDGRVMVRKFMSDDDKYVMEVAYIEEDTVDTNIFETEPELNDALQEWGKNYKFNE